MPLPSRREQADIVDGKDSLIRKSAPFDLRETDVPSDLRTKGILDPQRYPLLQRRLNGRRMDDLGTEVRHLHGFAIRHGRYRKRLAYFSRIGRQDTIHIGPDLDLPCLGGCAGNRGRIIGAASTERGSFITPSMQ